MTKSNQTDIFQSFWHGGGLTPLAWCCYSSFIRGDQELDLYRYDNFRTPFGLTRRNAEKILPRDQLFECLGSYAPFSDVFRFNLLNIMGGWWVDADVYFCNNNLPEKAVIFAEEESGTVNNGQMKFPREHPVLIDVIDRLREMDFTKITWGDSGPYVLSDVLHDHGLYDQAISTFLLYPLNWTEAYKFWLPEFCIEIIERTKDSPFIHLYGSMYESFGIDIRKVRPLAGSFMDRLYLNQGVYDEFNLVKINSTEIRAQINDYLRQDWTETYRQDPYGVDLTLLK